MWRWPQGLSIAGIYSKDRVIMDSCILKIVFPKEHRKREDPRVQIRPISCFHWIRRRPGVLLHPLSGIPRRADPLLRMCTSLPAGVYLDMHSLSSQPAPGLDETTTLRTTWETELPEMGHGPPDLVQGPHRPEALYPNITGISEFCCRKSYPEDLFFH